MGRSLTLTEEAQVGELMAVFLDAEAQGAGISEDELLARCPSDVARNDLRERLEECRQLLRLREALRSVGVDG